MMAAAAAASLSLFLCILHVCELKENGLDVSREEPGVRWWTFNLALPAATRCAKVVTSAWLQHVKKKKPAHRSLLLLLLFLLCNDDEMTCVCV
jgi:hypothetical protein